MGFLGFNSINEAEAIGKREDEARAKREADPAYQQRERARLAKMFAPLIAKQMAMKAEMKGKPIMKINRPPQAGKFMRVAPSVAVPVEKMVM